MKNFIKLAIGTIGMLVTGGYLVTAEPGTCFINQFVFYAMVIFIIIAVTAIFRLKQQSDNEDK